MRQTVILFLILLALGCSRNGDTQGEWSIPSDEVLDGGPGKDGIPSIDNPNFISISEVDFLSDDDLVIGMVIDGQAKAYPHPILDWHEIINDELGSHKVAMTYCPLTGTGVPWDRVVNGAETTFGVSGKLYNTNLLPFDRETESYWSQIRLDCVNGALRGETAEVFASIETTWATWKQAYPQSLVVSTDTGFSRNYQNYPYGDYRTNDNNIIFPVSITDERLPAKERVLGLLTPSENKVYSIELFEEDRVIYDRVGGADYAIIGSKDHNYIVAIANSSGAVWSAVNGQLPVIAEDNEGNRLTLSGLIDSGPQEGVQLEQPTAFIGYFFSFGAFYEGIGIYE